MAAINIIKTLSLPSILAEILADLGAEVYNNRAESIPDTKCRRDQGMVGGNGS